MRLDQRTFPSHHRDGDLFYSAYLVIKQRYKKNWCNAIGMVTSILSSGTQPAFALPEIILHEHPFVRKSRWFISGSDG